MEPPAAIDTILRDAEERGFSLVNKSPNRSKTTYDCSRKRMGCTYTCKVSNGLVINQTEHTGHPVEPKLVMQESQHDNMSQNCSTQPTMRPND
jgi:hypothetical protein